VRDDVARARERPGEAQAAAEGEWDTLEDAARRAGALPGWLR